MKKKAPWKGGAERNKSMIEKLREKMREAGIDLYVVPSSDPHNSEYVSDYFQQRRFFCGFTGSAGTLVVTLEEACLFTDGRYYVQAERELAGSGIILMKSGSDGVPSVADYIVSKAHKGFTAGFDGSVTRAEWGNELEKRLKEKEAGIAWETDLGKELWSQRPPFPMAPAYVFPVEYAGESRAFKLERLREKMAELGADVHVLSSLDDICWLLNVRGGDVLHSPVVLSYVIVDMKKVFFYVHKEKFDAAARDEMEADGVEFRAYQDFYQDLEKVTGKILIDSRRANYKICRIVRAKEPVEGENPTLLMKAVKNPVEIAHLKEVHRYDGAAFVRFQYWLEKALESGEEVTEYSAAKKLEDFRREIQGYLDESFETISAYGANGAMMHYCAKPQRSAVLGREGFLLVDSGGQYTKGTTDSTRTLCLGPVTEEQKRHYTAVLKGMLRLSGASFLEGCSGLNLDILARGPVWELMMDYRCSTGHGVGFLLNVHEGPNRVGWKQAEGGECSLQAGMVTTDEPGIYVEGSHGIRIENELLCKKTVYNEYGQFLGFDVLTLIPVDTSALLLEEMEKKDIVLLNEYHQRVYEELEGLLPQDCRKWLFEKTRPAGLEEKGEKG